jgi:hypothetical protein
MCAKLVTIALEYDCSLADVRLEFGCGKLSATKPYEQRR